MPEKLEEGRGHQVIGLASVDSQQSRKPTRRVYYGIAVGLLILLIPFLIARNEHRPKIWKDCGGDPEIARSRGCHFDLIAFAWQTHECFDAPLVAEFAEFEDWTFWASEYGNETVPKEVAFLGERTLYITWRYHIVHCTFVWRQLHRAYEAGWIDSDLRRYGHTKHCQQMFLMEGQEFQNGRFYALPNDTVTTLANIIYPSCEKLGLASPKSSWWDGVPPRLIEDWKKY
ncbi:hypothetical protein F5884DRAFT_786520 [Xylogone sp. PMI_703]|nr:hypothetical protein F5884DRAFT_786520 [Xylogone sp. PMI_703]